MKIKIINIILFYKMLAKVFGKTQNKKNRITHLINECIFYNGRFETNKFILAIRVPFLKNFLRHQDA